MAIDRREDAGEFYPGGRAIAVRREPSAVAPLSSSSQPGADAGDYYPGGKVISTRPVATGGDVKHSDFEGLDVKTNTIPDLREAVRELVRRLGATVVTALAVCVAIGATVEKAKLNELDFDADPSVVTNVTFEGLATTNDLAAAANELRGEIAGKAEATKDVVTTRWRFDPSGLILEPDADDSWAADDANYMQYVADRGVYRWTIAGYGAGLCRGGADAAMLTNATGTAYTFTRLIATNRYDVAYVDDVAAAVAPLCTIEAAEAMRAAESNRVDALLGDYLPRTSSAITAAGVTTDYLINSSMAGGIRIRYSSRDLNNYTSYGYRGVTARRNGVGEDWLWDATDANGIVRRKELAGITTEETDPTVPAWAKESTKPAYTAAEVGAATSEDLVAVSNLVSGATVITQKEWKVQREYTRNVAVTNVQLMAGQIFAGLALIETNLVAVVPVIGTTACVRVWAPYAEGYHTPNQFSAIEIGDGNQALCSQRIIAGQALYCPNPSMLRFTDGLDPADQEDTCTSLQDYLDVLSPDTIASLTAGLVPTTGDSVIDGSLTVNGSITANGQLISDGTIVITNADIIAKGFSVINRNLTADGMTISNGMCHIRCALLDLGLGTPRIHLENGTGASDFDGAALTNITFGGTWPAPTTNLRDYMHDLIDRRIINELSINEERFREIVQEELEIRNAWRDLIREIVREELGK